MEFRTVVDAHRLLPEVIFMGIIMFIHILITVFHNILLPLLRVIIVILILMIVLT